MRILLCNNAYPTELNPKSASYVKTIHKCLIEAGLNVDLLVLHSNHKNMILKYFNYAKFFYRVLTFSRYSDYDWIYLHHPTFYFFLLAPRLPESVNLSIHWHGTELFPPTSFHRLIFWMTTKMVPSKCSHIVPSQYLADCLKRRMGIKNNSIKISPSGGVDIRLFKPNRNHDDYKESNFFRLGFSSALDTQKGIDLIIELLDRLDQKNNSPFSFSFDYIFYGKNKEKYHKLLKRYDKTRCWQVLPTSEMVNYYNSIDILLFPTKRESLGLVALEAMSCNVPVIGPRDFAIPEYVIPGKSGELFENGNVIDFEKALMTCVDNYKNYNPRPIVEQNYSKEKVVQDYKEFFQLNN